MCIQGHKIAGVLLVAAGFVRAATISESFATDPMARGWRKVGDTNLFQWNSTNQNLEVTWDSSRTNSFFQLPLGTVLASNDNFSIAFDLRMRDITIGTSSNKPYTFQIALGFLNSVSATNANAFRGAGQNTIYGVRNTIEFDYFPDSGFGATFAPTMITSNNRVAFSHSHPLELTSGDLFHIEMRYAASNQVLKTAVTRNGSPYGLPPMNSINDLALSAFPDFRLDSLAIINWSDAVQAGPLQFWGSILAHGTIDNLVATVPDGPLGAVVGTRTNSTWRTTFASKTNWFYSLERTEDFATWTVASATNSGTGGTMLLQDANAAAAQGFYRVKALRP